ncbi:hypothetical protein MBT84_06070 [Streptomyces sp. MBT84]|uniref:DUF5134 domain-containing protein n=1 Tax=Streptomyces sp. MBT84 TaxID=1488414 RepID=UPI001C6DD566|nr:DUF5134 domain-containing protein [Streptomyces sp. MBT84]MBW8699149.1 hypothetical protein [Streptomyces sp. MBT84]
MDTPVDVVHVMLTMLFALVAVHALRRGVRLPGTGRRDRVDHLLHFAMAVAMAAMAWSPGRPLSGLTMTVLFTGATLWFPLTALHRRRADTAAAIAGRLQPAAGMAAMAWMPRTPHGRAVSSHETLAGGVPVAHHGTALGHPAGASTTVWVTSLLAVYLLACAMRSLTRPMPSLRSATDAVHRAAARDPYGHLRDGAMALGTAVMVLMPH